MILLLGLAAGVVMGLTGAGGSILSVPLLMWGMDWTLPQAAPVSLLAVCASAWFGTVTRWDVSVVRYRAAGLMAAAGLVTAPLGIWLAGNTPLHLLSVVFAAVLVAVAAHLWRNARPPVAGPVPAAPLCRVNPGTGRMVWSAPTALAIAGIGAATGLLAGLLGIGAFVIVAALRSLTELTMHAAVATSLFATALISAATLALNLLAGRPIPWLLAIPFGLSAVGGTLAGRALTNRIGGPPLQRIFAALLACAAGAIAAHAWLGLE